MAVFVIGELEIKNNSTLPVVAQSRILGGTGWIVADITARNAIPAGSREEAMEVKVIDAGGSVTRYYSLAANLTTWTETGSTTFWNNTGDTTLSSIVNIKGAGTASLNLGTSASPLQELAIYADTLIQSTLRDAATVTAPEVLRIAHQTTATAGVGFGATFNMQLHNAAGGGKNAFSIEAKWLNASAGSEDALVTMKSIRGGSSIDIFSYSSTIDILKIGRGAGSTSGTVNANSISFGLGANSGSLDVGIDSVAVGNLANSPGSQSGAFGYKASSAALRALAFGMNMTAGAIGAMIIGNDASNTITNARTNSFALAFNSGANIPVLWIEAYSTITVGIAGQDTILIPLDASSTYIIEANVVGGETDATPTMYGARKLKALYTRIGAGSAVEELEVSDTIMRSIAGATENISIDIDPSGNDARITVKGPNSTSTNMTWLIVVTLSKGISN